MLNRPEYTGEPEYSIGAGRLLKNWDGHKDNDNMKGPKALGKGKFPRDPHPPHRSPKWAQDIYDKEAAQKQSKEEAKLKTPEGEKARMAGNKARSQKAKIDKAELGFEDKSQLERETFRGGPREEGRNVLDTVSRDAHSKLQELMGQKKEDAALTKQVDPYFDIKKAREIILGQGWESQPVKPING